jgi:hypothetical protein
MKSRRRIAHSKAQDADFQSALEQGFATGGTGISGQIAPPPL